MKIVFILAAVLAVSLAAPTEVAVPPGKIAIPEKTVLPESEKISEQNSDKVVSPQTESIVEDKVELVSTPDKVVENNDAEQVKDKVEEKLEEKLEEKIENKVKVSQVVTTEEEVLPAVVEEQKPVVVVVATPVKNEEKEKEEEKIEVHETSTKEKETKEEQETAEKEKDCNDFSAICRASTGVTLQQVLAVVNEPLIEPARPVKCYLKCMDEHLGRVKDEDSIKDSATDSERPSKVPKEEAETVDDPCVRPQTDDPCDSAYLRFYCNFRSSDKISVL